MNFHYGVLIITLCLSASALARVVPLAEGYRTPDTVQLTKANFKSNVKQSREPWVIVFCKGTCPYCKKLSSQWEKVAANLKNDVRFGAVNIKSDADLYAVFSPFVSDGVPCVVYLDVKSEKGGFREYDGDYDASELENWIVEQLKNETPNREQTNSGAGENGDADTKKQHSKKHSHEKCDSHSSS